MRTIAILLTAFFLAAGVQAQGKGKGKGKGRNWDRNSYYDDRGRDRYDRDDDWDNGDRRYRGDYGRYSYGYGAPIQVNFNIRFNDNDRRYLRDWARRQPIAALPVGLTYRDLPPGLRKQLIRKGSLPPGLQARITPVPVVLVQRMRPLPAGYDYVFLDRRAFIVARATGAILDVISLF